MTRLNLIFSFAIVLKLQANHIHLTLKQALDKKYVKAEARSLGGYQGYCIQLQLKNLSKETLHITVEAGRRLNSLDEQYQDILIVKEELIVLNTKEYKCFSVKGYCCQAANRCPVKQSKYDLNKLADSNLVKVARYLSANEFDQSAEQEAVWAVSDNRPAANIATMNDSLLQPLRETIAGLKGEVLPWYRIISKRYVTRLGTIVSIPFHLQGELYYSNPTDDYVTLSVKNEDGMPVCLIKSQWLKSELQAVYKLDLPIGGLERGKYVVELRAGARELSRREFVL
jgi:hypothetical protein